MRHRSHINPLLLAPLLALLAPLLALLAPSTLLWAQSHAGGESAAPETRQQLLRRTREAKSERLEPYAISRAEERVQFLEEWRLPRRLFAKGIGGFRPVLGGMPSGSGFVVGGGYITGYNSDLAQFTANARFSTRGYQTFDAGLLLFPRANSLLPVEGYVRTGGRDLTSLRFFGLGPASGRGDRTTYRLQDRNIETGITGWAGRFGEFSGRVQWLTTETGAGRAGVSLETSFDPTTIPGFGAEINHFVYGGRAVVHLRESTVSPSVGVTLAVDAARYDDRDSDDFDFTRVVGDVQALIPLGYRNRILALHARTSHSVGEHGGTAPFDLMETLGGGEYHPRLPRVSVPRYAKPAAQCRVPLGSLDVSRRGRFLRCGQGVLGGRRPGSAEPEVGVRFRVQGPQPNRHGDAVRFFA